VSGVINLLRYVYKFNLNSSCELRLERRLILQGRLSRRRDADGDNLMSRRVAVVSHREIRETVTVIRLGSAQPVYHCLPSGSGFVILAHCTQAFTAREPDPVQLDRARHSGCGSGRIAPLEITTAHAHSLLRAVITVSSGSSSALSHGWLGHCERVTIVSTGGRRCTVNILIFHFFLTQARMTVAAFHRCGAGTSRWMYPASLQRSEDVNTSQQKASGILTALSTRTALRSGTH